MIEFFLKIYKLRFFCHSEHSEESDLSLQLIRFFTAFRMTKLPLLRLWVIFEILRCSKYIAKLTSSLEIEVGMEALVVPSTVKPQEHGYLKAKVTHVSEFPVTQQGMMTVMKNDQLVRGLLQLGAPFEVHVEFIELYFD